MRLRTLAVVLLLGCSDPAGVVYALEDFEVTASVSSATVREQLPTTVTVTVTNVGPVRRFISAGCVERFVVITTDGARVGPGEVVCAQPCCEDPVALAPGETFTYESLWRGEAYRPALTESRLVPPGMYLLRGVVWPVPRSYGDAKRASFEPALSEPVEVTMLPPY